MHAGRRYSLIGLAQWTRRETFTFALIASVPVVLDAVGIVLPSIPWAPIAMLGTAVAFVTGFKSNAAYGRLWEARTIWGGIVNASRTWALFTRYLIASFTDSAMRVRWSAYGNACRTQCPLCQCR